MISCFLIYSDGVVAVDYLVDVDPTMVKMNVPLFGSIYLDTQVVDQDGLPLDSSSTENGLDIDTLGSISAYISYFSTNLTVRDGQIWTFTVTVPISSTILLPVGSTIIFLSFDHLALENVDEGVLITTPVGELEIVYTIEIVGTWEYALAVVKDR